MALITCLKCGGPVSTKAEACPRCGARQNVIETPTSSGQSESPPKNTNPESNTGVWNTAKNVQVNRTDAVEPAKQEVNKPLWNPIIITLLGFPLGFAFSSVLAALNWHALKRHFIGVLVWISAIVFLTFVQNPLTWFFPWPWPWILGGCVWFAIIGLPQLQYFRKKISGYSRRGWLTPISIGIAVQIILFVYMKWEASSEQLPIPSEIPASQRDLTPEELVQQVGSTVFEVQTHWREPYWIFFSSEKGVAGSAVLIRSEPGILYLATNRHVVEPPVGATNYSCSIDRGNGPVPVDVLAYGKNGIDVALLRLRSDEVKDSFSIPMLPLKEIAVGQGCVAIGNALGAGDSVTTGVVSRFDDFGTEVRIRTSAPISPGNSGGGLFSLKGGYLIGITTANIPSDNAQNINLAIPTDYFTGKDAWEYLPGVSP